MSNIVNCNYCYIIVTVFLLQLDRECRCRIDLLATMSGEFEQFESDFEKFDRWLALSEDNIRLMQRSLGDLDRLQEQTKAQLVSLLSCNKILYYFLTFSSFPFLVKLLNGTLICLFLDFDLTKMDFFVSNN